MRSIVFLVSLCLLAVGSNAPVSAGERSCAAGAALHVRLTGFESNGGNAAVALFDSKRGHLARNPIRSASLPIDDGGASWRITNLPCGVYSLLAFHDENGNGRLDTRALGIPAERYGASNDARRLFGPPRFGEAAFEVDGPAAEVGIRLR